MSKESNKPPPFLMPPTVLDLVVESEKKLAGPDGFSEEDFTRIIVEPLAQEAVYHLLVLPFTRKERKQFLYSLRACVARVMMRIGRAAFRRLEDMVITLAQEEARRRRLLNEPVTNGLMARYLARELAPWKKIYRSLDGLRMADPEFYSRHTPEGVRNRQYIFEQAEQLMQDPPAFFLKALAGHAVSRLEMDLLAMLASDKWEIHLPTLAVGRTLSGAHPLRSLKDKLRQRITEAAKEIVPSNINNAEFCVALTYVMTPMNANVLACGAWEDILKTIK